MYFPSIGGCELDIQELWEGVADGFRLFVSGERKAVAVRGGKDLDQFQKEKESCVRLLPELQARMALT